MSVLEPDINGTIISDFIKDNSIDSTFLNSLKICIQNDNIFNKNNHKAKTEILNAIKVLNQLMPN